MTQETKKAYASPALTIYGGVAQLTQRPRMFGSYHAHSSNQTFGHLSHMPLIAPHGQFNNRFFHSGGRR